MGPPSILVNNAGSARDQPLQLMTVDDWDSVLNVHLRAAFLACRAIRPHLLANRWGRIVNISSISGRGHPDRVNYCSAKAGLEGLTRALAIELGPLGVTVNAIAPGLIVTRMTENTAARLGRSLADHVQQAAATIPVRRTGTPDDIAAPTAFFCSEEAGFITGQTLYAAGGPV
jgi:3-oxoacyl-[acyl-carrier protein] reductase